MASDFKYEIIQHVCVLSDRNNGWRKECNLVRWNDGTTKFDIRDWSYDRSAMSKGVTLTKTEFLQLQKNIRFVRMALWDKSADEDPKERAVAAPPPAEEAPPEIPEGFVPPEFGQLEFSGEQEQMASGL